MPQSLPPLTALKAFEAAARHMSFAHAAEELSVTPAALSYQIKNLEAHLGTPLFIRLNRAVELTDAGKALLPGISDGFEMLRKSWRSARKRAQTQRLVITAGPAFTAKWLGPRLFRFAAQHPEIELRFVASLKLADLRHEDIDIAIRLTTRDFEGVYQEPLFEEWLTPMAAPQLGLKSLEDLARYPLIRDESLHFLPTVPDWNVWAKAAGASQLEAQGPILTQADHALDVALSGTGVALGRASIAEEHLRLGQLVAPFPVKIPAGAGYSLMCRAGTETLPPIKAFRDWMATEIQRTHHLWDDLHNKKPAD